MSDPAVSSFSNVSGNTSSIFNVLSGLRGVLSDLDHVASAHRVLAVVDAEVDLDEEVGNLHENDNMPELQDALDRDWSDDESDWDSDDEEDHKGKGPVKLQGFSNIPSNRDAMDVDVGLYQISKKDGPAAKATELSGSKYVDPETATQLNEKNPPIPEAIHRTAAQCAQSIKGATLKRYTSLCKQFEAYCEKNGFKELGTNAIRKDSHPNSLLVFISWNPDGTMKLKHEVRSGYSHAEKERAAVLWGYQQVGLTDPCGNPIASFQVSKYMSNLKRQKVQDSEKPTSSRAITAKMIQQMWDTSQLGDRFEIKPVEPKSHCQQKDPNVPWCGGRMLWLLHFVYVISFLCLLRIDEALKIQAMDIQLVQEYDEHGDLLVLWLPFWKTHQHGTVSHLDIKPFYLREFPEELAYLCPVHAYAGWKEASNIKKGMLCHKIHNDDRIEHDETEAMTSQAFIAAFRQNLADIHVDGDPYGGHSFRHGGVQWLSVNRRWPLCKICEWGRWSEEFTHLTIIKYLIS
uniref:Uncharacterized protein n=1 Tax=Moniliophthora roreri TaxID=221103 RepID=A0A0W0G3W9_MONRR